jgi:hypothetical protein
VVIRLNYDRQIVLALFAQANPGKLDPSPDDIAEFDTELKDANEDMLVDIMGQMGIPADVSNKSQVLAYKPNMPGNTPRLKIRNACTYFLNTREGAAPRALMPATKKRPKPKAKKKRPRTQ